MGFLQFLIDNDYKHILVPKRSRTRCYVTKTKRVSDATKFEEWIMETEEEKELLKIFDKNTLISLHPSQKGV